MFAHVVPQIESVEMETDSQTYVMDYNTPDQKVVNTLASSGEIHQPAAAPVSMDETSSSADRNDDLDTKSYSNRLNGFRFVDGANSDPRPPLSDELQQGYRILEDLMADSKKTNNFLFMDPVDADDPQMKDYYQRIQEPMCLRTMLEKFDSRTYTDITEFYDDFMLMIKNCCRYWGPDHRMGKKAERFHTMFQQKIALLSSKVKEKMTKHSKGVNDDISCSGIRRRGRSYVTQDSLKIFQEVQQEREQEEKEQRLRQQAERKAERKAQEQEIRDWDKNVLFEQKEHEMKAMWQIPQIQAFLWAAKQSLNLEEINIYETERAFYMPRESSAMQKVMTCLLSTPAQRAGLGRRNAKPMTYSVWNEKLAKRVALWYKTLKDCSGNHVEAASKLGIDKLFFCILGKKRNPLEKKAFHELTPFQRVWLVKSLCDNILEMQEEIRTAMDNENADELRGLELGQDAKGFTYIHFPQFCGPAVRFYRQAPLPDPTLDSEEEEEEEEEEEVAKGANKRGKPSASSSSSRNSRSGTSTPQPAQAKANSKKTSFKSRRLNGQQAEDISPAPGTPSSSTQNDFEETSSSKSKSRSKSRGKGSIRARKTRNGINDDFDKLSDGTIDSIDTSDKVSQGNGRTCNGFKEKDESSGACEDNLMDDGSVQPKSQNNNLKGAEPENRGSEGDVSSVEDKMELGESELFQDGSRGTGKTAMCNGDSQGRSEEEEMDWKPSSHESQSSCGGGEPNSSICANSSSPQVKQEGGDMKAASSVGEAVKVKVEPGVASASSIKTESDSGNIPKSESGVVSDTGTAAPKQEVEEGTVKQEAEQDEEDEEDDVEITGPVIGEFELIADSVEALRQVVEELETPETVVSKKGKRKVTKQVPRKACDQELAARMRVSVEELSAWETRLNAATSRARVKIRKEFEEYTPEESLQQDSADWETDPSSSGNEEDHSAQDMHADLQGGAESSLDNSEVKTGEGASPAPMEYEVEFSSRGRMRKKKTNPDERPAKRQRTGDGGEESASRLPNILQRQNKTPGPTISILSPPGRAGLPGATIQVAVSRPEVSSAQFSASQLLKLSQSKGKAAIGVVPVSTRPALLRSPAGASSKTGAHPVIQQLLSKQPQFTPRTPTASSLLVRQPVLRPQSVTVPVAASAGSASSSAVNVQYIFTNNTGNTPSSSGNPRAQQQTISMTPAMLQQLLQLTQVRPQGNSSAGTAARVLAVSQQPSAGTLKSPQTPKPSQTILLTSQSVTPSTPSLTQPASNSDTSPIQQAQLAGVAVAAAGPTAQVAVGGLKPGQGTKYASNVTVKALLENRAAQKAGVSVQGGTNQIVLAANAAGVPTLLSRIQPAAAVTKPAKLTIQVPTPDTKTFSGDLDSAVRLVVTSVSTSLPTANIHVPSPALSPNLPRGAPAKTIMTSVMEQPIVTTKVQPITGQASTAQTSCLSSTVTAQTSLSMSAVKLASTPTLTTSPSPQKTLVCKVVQPGGQPVFQIVLPQGSLQQLSPTIQLGPTTTVAGSSAVSLSPSASPASASPTAQQTAAVKAQLAGGLRTIVSATVQQTTAPTVTSPAASAAKQLTISPQARLVQAPAAALVKQIAASQLAQAGSLVRVQGPAGSLAAGQVAGNLSTTSLLQQLSPGADQAVVGQPAVLGQPAVVAAQAGQVIKAAGAGKTGYVLNITPTPAAAQQRLQTVAVENPSSATTSASTVNSVTVSKAASPGLAQVSPHLLPQQPLNLQLLQNKLAGLVQGQGASQPTRVVLMAQPGSSQPSSLTQTVLQQASPQLGQQVIARGINASLAGQPQIVLTPSAATAKTQLLVPGLVGRNVGLNLVPVPQSAGMVKLSGVTSAASAPALTAVNTAHQEMPTLTLGVIDPAAAMAALQQAELKAARTAVSPASQTGIGVSKPSTPASAPLSSHSTPQAAVSSLAAQSATRVAGKPAGAVAAATTSSSAASATKPAGDAGQRIRLLRVNSQLYTAEGIPVAVGSDGQLRALPLPHIQLPASIQQAMRNPEMSVETAAAKASSTSASLPSPVQSLAVSSPSDSDTSPRAGSSIGRQQLVLSPSKLMASTAASTGSNPVSRSQQQQPQMQQKQPRNVGDGLLLINFAQSNQ